MPSFKTIGLIAITLLASQAVADDNEITFCKLPYMPKQGSPEDVANCVGQYGYNLNGCYTIPSGFGLIGQSFMVTEGLGECALFHDSSCRSPDPEKAWYGVEAENMGQDFFSFRCKCQNRC